MTKYLMLILFSVEIFAAAELPCAKRQRRIAPEDYDSIVAHLEAHPVSSHEADALLKYLDLSDESKESLEIDELLNSLSDAIRRFRKSNDLCCPVVNQDGWNAFRNKIRCDTRVSFLEPLLTRIYEVVQEEIKGTSKYISHITLRIDPDCEKMFRNLNRGASKEWHTHGDDESYLFTLTDSDNLTTQVKPDGQDELSIEKNKLFHLKPNMEHRTPPQAKGYRIHISYSVKRDYSEG